VAAAIAASSPQTRPLLLQAGHAIFAGGHKFDAETTRIMEMAFDMALVAPRLADRADVSNEVELISPYARS
jgi:hypothetical protein